MANQNIRVFYHYEGPRPDASSAFKPQIVARSETEQVVVSCNFNYWNYGNATEPDIRTALTAAGVPSTNYGGKSLVLESYRYVP